MASPRLRRFATLYVNGPSAGQWEACAEQAGFKPGEYPSPADPRVRTLISSEGGVPPELAPEARAELEDPFAIIAREAAKPDINWDVIPNLENLMVQILVGEKKASAGQVSLLRELIARKHGRVGEGKDNQQMNVMLLPALSPDGKYFEVCPRCHYRLKEDQ